MPLPTDYHRLVEASHPTGHTPDAGALMGLADLLHEHSLPGAALVSHLAQRAQSGEVPAGLHNALAERYYDRVARTRMDIPRGIFLHSGEAAGWGIAPSRKRYMERTQDPMAQQLIGQMTEEQKQTIFGPEHPILAAQFPYKHSSGTTTLATHYVPILSHAHAEEITRDWPDEQRARLLNHLSIAEKGNIPQDHNAPGPTPADAINPNAREHAGQPGKKAKLARKKPKAASNELALAVRGGIKRALQDFAIDRGMPEELRGADFDRRAVAVEKELVEVLKSPGGGRFAELRGHLTRSKVGADGGVEFPTPASVAGLLSAGKFAGMRVLEALAAHRAEKAGKDYGAQIAHWNPKTTAPEKPKPSGFVELPKDQTKAVIAQETADQPLVGTVAPPSDPGTVKPVDGRSFRSRANKTAAAQELPKPAFEVVPEPEAKPLAVSAAEPPKTRHADAIAAALFSPGTHAERVARAHSALEALGMTNRGSRNRAIKQHLEYRRAATKLRRVRLNRAQELHKAWRRDEAPLFAVAEHLHDEGHPAAAFFSHAALNHDAPGEQAGHAQVEVRESARRMLLRSRVNLPGSHYAHLTHRDGILRAHVHIPLSPQDPYGAMFSAHMPLRSKAEARQVLGAFPTLVKYVEHSSLPEAHEPTKLRRVRLNRTKELHTAWTAGKAPLFAIAEHLHDLDHPAAEFFSHAALNHDAPGEQDALRRGSGRYTLGDSHDSVGDTNAALTRGTAGDLQAHVYVRGLPDHPDLTFRAHVPLRSKEHAAEVLGAFPNTLRAAHRFFDRPTKLARVGKKDITGEKVDAAIAGTRLAYHLKQIAQEFGQRSQGRAHDEKGKRIGLLAKAALGGDRAVYAELGQSLAAVGHPMGEKSTPRGRRNEKSAAYNWSTVGRSLHDDDLMRRFVKEQFSHTGLDEREVYRRLVKHYGALGEIAKTGSGVLNAYDANRREWRAKNQAAHDEFWRRAREFWAKHHPTHKAGDLDRRINNSMLRVQKIAEERADLEAAGKAGTKGYANTSYGDAGGEGKNYHMRFKREK